MRFKDKLIRMHACPKGVIWVRGRSPASAWRDCPNVSWMYWMLSVFRINGVIDLQLFAEAGRVYYDFDFITPAESSNADKAEKMRLLISPEEVAKMFNKFWRTTRYSRETRTYTVLWRQEHV